MQEQRRYIRYDAEGNAILKPEDGTSRNLKADLVDISYAGLGVAVYGKIETGIKVKFELITRLYDRPIVGEGKVKYLQELQGKDASIFRLGIEFTNINNEDIRCVINSIQEDLCAEARRRRTG